ncbi:MAG: TetR family transcriptional regulator [Desulfovibrio piger]|jgi:AcrR family transcriptional regulator|uniref:TetR/AcrR family transcriptional regulator n=1 Tax=Desulfovibrio TaxID=872 RepID=UPI002628294E|nr:TetR/AcrR family transcriptional regulator [Desulfovibrio piger]
MDDMLEDKRRSKGEATRMALLEAALVLFGERGFEGTSTRDIAGLAGCNQGLISFHFGGKEGLYDAARTVIFENLGSIVRPMTRRLEEALAAETDAAALCGMLQTEITAILTAFIRKQHHQSWFLLLRRSLHVGDEKTRELHSALFLPLLDVIGRILAKAGPAGEDSALKAFLLVDMAFSILRDYPMFSAISPARDAEADARELAGMLFRGILAR